MSITTEDCKKVLCEIYDTKVSNWKRVKKYKLDGIWYRDFENEIDGYNATLKEKNGQLYLVPQEVIEKIEEKQQVGDSSLNSDSFSFNLGSNLDIKVYKAECADSVIEESFIDIGIGPALYIDGTIDEATLISHVQSSMDKIFGKNFVELDFSYGVLMFEINRTETKEGYYFSQYIDTMLVLPFVLDALNVSDFSQKQKLTKSYVKDLLRHADVDNYNEEDWGEDGFNDFDSTDGFGPDGYLYRNDKKLCKIKDMTWDNFDLVVKNAKYADPVIKAIYEKMILNEDVVVTKNNKKGCKL